MFNALKSEVMPLIDIKIPTIVDTTKYIVLLISRMADSIDHITLRLLSSLIFGMKT